MIFPRLRPRLEMSVSLTPAELAARVEAMLAAGGSPCRGFANEGQIELHIAESQRRYFSPQLLVNLTRDGEGAELVGHFGPNGNVWTMFLAAYAFVALSALTGLFLGVSQLIAQESAWGLWLVPAGGALIVMIYIAAAYGQRLGAKQTHILQEFLESAIDSETSAAR